jgi:hypothetical protein
MGLNQITAQQEALHQKKTGKSDGFLFLTFHFSASTHDSKTHQDLELLSSCCSISVNVARTCHAKSLLSVKD